MTRNDKNSQPERGTKRRKAPQPGGVVGPLTRMTRNHGARQSAGTSGRLVSISLVVRDSTGSPFSVKKENTDD
jgi:hypothetical protein